MDPLSKYESVVDKQIREAAERGEFDDLPGAGKPLPGLGGPDDELWWIKRYIQREGLSGEALLPPALQLRAELERLPETVRDLPSEQLVADAVRDLNRRIAEYLRAPSGPHVPVGPARVEEIVAGWRTRSRPVPDPGSPATDPPGPPATERPARRRRWRRRAG